MACNQWITVTLLVFCACLLLLEEIIAAKISCIKCSSANDTNCARAKLEPTECAQEDDQCFFRIFNDNLIRGCYADLNAIEQASCDSNGGMCVKCQQSGCNNAYWPRCHTCVENADVGCEDEQSDSSKASFCSVFKSDNYCFASLNNDIVSRGCGSDYPDCLTNRQTCQMCYNDGCNSLSKTGLTESKCQKCYSLEDDCIYGNSSAIIANCSRLGDPCFTTIRDGKIQRGCLDFSDNVKLCSDPTDATCVACQGANCNANPWLRCHQCRVTDADKTCNEEKADQSKTTFCRNHQVNDRCYSRTVDGVFERGCQSDLGANANACDNLDEKKCQLCAEPGCNKYKNSAEQFMINLTVLLLGVIAALFMETF